TPSSGSSSLRSARTAKTCATGSRLRERHPGYCATRYMSSTAPVRDIPRRNAQPAGGSSHAVATLYERYYQRVYGFCLYHLGSRVEAEDAPQTTFLSALRALERGVVPRMEANWLFTIARGTCRGRFRSRGLSRGRELLCD